ncbi:glycosyltransferase [Planctomyces sp. SH-PL62]|uniref:glycosyltransferase n=1 Tax=Planctomyces sp. SH-PL62 TaxID=1636152 RepID=UPI00078DA03C|nr:glycosyltransferase [Planctomyces sp. SH-PL62]AMV36277.1 Undecaprenyl-phosphate mannosyltransferase [Planctomyces sp. SH-PL62]
MTRPEDPRRSPTIAVAIPCYNEAAAVGRVVDDFRAHLPGADVVIFDNASEDDTAAIAAAHGARVVAVPDRGKGFVVRAAFATLKGYDVVVMTDGDGTYPAEAAPRLVAPVLDGRAAMTVGARRPVPGAQAMAPVRALGNVLIRGAFRLLIGVGAGDLLSGYRAFSRRFVETVDLRSEGFEIETELAVAATAGDFPTLEVEVAYHPRIAGTESKLRAFRDGRRILRTIVREGLRLRPLRAAALLAAFASLVIAAILLLVRR